MFFRILKRDFKRKKTMNAILLLFIILASMFVAGGINNVVAVLNGTDYYLDKAGVEDFVVITGGDIEMGELDKVLSNEPAIESYQTEKIIYGSSESVVNIDGTKLKSKNATIFQSIDDTVIHLFDKDNKEITEVKKGYVYISSDFMNENNFKEGDKLLLNLGDVRFPLIIQGKAKDALLGNSFMGNSRFIMNAEDMAKLLADETLSKHYQGQIGYIKTNDTSAVSAALSDAENIMFQGDRAMIKMCYVMEMIVAFIVLILSVCLIIVSFVVLKFTITMTIREEYREIGVMKAVGIKNSGIRGIYMTKYLIMAVAGSLIGLIASIPFGAMLLDSASKNMLLGNDNVFFTNILGTVAVVLVVVGFAYFCTRRVNKLSPVDAIRSGQTGERYKKKSKLRIGKVPFRNSLFMAVNDIVSSPKRFITITFSFFICTLFVLLLVNTTETMDSDMLIDTFGTKSDLYVTDVGLSMRMQNEGNKDVFIKELNEKAQQISEAGMPCNVVCEVQYTLKIKSDDKEYTVICSQGVGTKMEDYTYLKGVVPANVHEIAITEPIAKKIHAGIGDTVLLDFGRGQEKCMITAIYQTFNQLGETIRIHEDVEVDYQFLASSYQINFTDHPSETEIQNRKKELKILLNNDEVRDSREYCIDTMKVLDTMKAVQYLLLLITLIVVFLITILMERSFIEDEKSQIAILKAIGFGNRTVIWWHVLRFAIVGGVAVLLAGAASVPVTNLVMTPVFEMMGVSKVEYNIVPIKLFVVYPGIILGVTVLVAVAISLYTRRIKSRDTANNE